MKHEHKKVLFEPLLENNPILLQVLGICSALAVTTRLAPALMMCVALTAVLVASSVVISMIRHHIPGHIRIIVFVTIISTFVVLVEQVLRAFAFDLANQLSVFIGLIITNCIVLGRAEAFASKHPLLPSLLDALGHGAGYSALLIIVASLRELFGSGTLLGVTILQPVSEGGWYQPNGLMLLAPSAFFIIALLIWAVRSWKREQVEKPEFRISHIAQDDRE
ncbi:MAG: NADH:ubiquinone reductase (Na(+)-transporting) subunit D [Gammaproteobacteria bacterium]|nr:NADH:ubiquinone reductase (Na(+)-transporting) subunit D [Gammaproteobacteria bacterium]MDH5650508.1 NADH:ubiquinone reductase (Na(+)-transporting) subunit D [Gammaproteobacteria bacterium]